MAEPFERFVTIISLLHKNIQRMKQIEMQELGLKGPHVMCLFYLSHNPDGLNASELSQYAGVDKAATSRVLTQLTQLGLICYQPKKYRSRAVLTDEGTAVAQQVNQTIAALVQEITAGIDPEERETMYRCLYTISDNIRRKLPVETH